MKTLSILLFSGIVAVGNVWAADGFLKVNAKPGRAGVFVDGKYVGPAKNYGSTRKYTLPEGEHEIRLSEPRYEDLTKKVTITGGKTTKLSEVMTASPLAQGPFGRIRVTNGDKYDAVYINNKFYGHIDEFDNFAQGILIPPGEYTVRIQPVTGNPVETKVTVTANQITFVKAKP
ncbi:MAG: PEGA domain-containing protein [Bryobacteraceae bacterium]|nr:PEGA domain-containing protein [Bryobacteraceae bacterium]